MNLKKYVLSTTRNKCTALLLSTKRKTENTRTDFFPGIFDNADQHSVAAKLYHQRNSFRKAFIMLDVKVIIVVAIVIHTSGMNGLFPDATSEIGNIITVYDDKARRG